MPAPPVDSNICDKAVTDIVLSALRITSDDAMLSRPTPDKAIFVPAYMDAAPVALSDIYPVLATDRPVEPAKMLIDPPVLSAR